MGQAEPGTPLRAASPGEENDEYLLTLSGLVLPLGVHFVFDAVAAGCIVLIGHPWMAAVFFAATAAIDVINQSLIARWLAQAPKTEPGRGFKTLAALCALRVSVYVAPTLAMALRGGETEAIFLCVQLISLIPLAQAAGVLRRSIFWAFALPVVAAASVLALAKLSLLPALGCLGSLVVLTGLLHLISHGSYQAISTWRSAFNANVELVRQLQLARDRAVAEREAADLAREAARQANRAKSNFLATMSHEIRTPMNGVLGMAQLLKRDEVNPAQAKRLDVLIESGEYLLGILNDILDVSKIDAGRLEIMPAAEDLRLFLDRLVGFWGARADEKRVALILSVDPSTPEFVMMDALRLRQVMFNLIGNALKFTEAGAVEVIADARTEHDGTHLVHLAVRDSGPGIAAEHLPILFERFSQADESEMRRFGGTGLGLAIAKQLTELMGGRIWVESRLGEGSTFHVEVPLHAAHAGTHREAAGDEETAAELIVGLNLLCVDDNAVNLLVLDQLLSSLGHKIAKASSGREALEMMDTQPFDLVLLDIQMPGMGGVEVLTALRSGEGPNRDTPVVALTADVISGGRERYVELGFTDHASKPIQLVELSAAMARALSAETEDEPERRSA